MRTLTVLQAFAALALTSAGALELGKPVPDFTLPGADGDYYTLSEFKDKAALAVVFTCNHCPVAQAYQDRIIKLQKDYAHRGFTVIAVNPNDTGVVPDDGFEEMKKRARKKRFSFPYLRDRTQFTAAAYGATATPHVFLLDRGLVLRYRGGIDDSWRKPDEVKAAYLRDAIEAVLADKPVATPDTSAFGCSIKWHRPGPENQTPFTIADSPAAARPLAVGHAVPRALVADMKGRPVWLHDRLKGKPTVLVFFRGGWCPFCTKHLAGLAAVTPQLVKRGYQVIAVSPDTPAGTLKGVAKSGVDYELLSDLTMEASLAFGLAFRLDDATLVKYRGYGIPLRSPPGRTERVLPVPALYLVDAKGKITFAHHDVDYKQRLDPQAVLDAAQ